MNVGDGAYEQLKAFTKKYHGSSVVIVRVIRAFGGCYKNACLK